MKKQAKISYKQSKLKLL